MDKNQNKLRYRECNYDSKEVPKNTLVRIRTNEFMGKTKSNLELNQRKTTKSLTNDFVNFD